MRIPFLRRKQRDQPPRVAARPDPPRTGAERRTELLVLLAFGVTGACGLALLVLYALGGQTQLEGLLLCGALGGIGVGIVLWGQRLMPTRIHIEPRGRVGGGPEAVADLEETLGEEANFSRRTLLLRGLGLAIGALGAALAIPIFSLGPAPGRSLFVTSWRSGRRLAAQGAQPVRATDVPVGGVVTVFPDGDSSDPNTATLLIRLGTTAAGAQAATPGATPAVTPGASAAPGAAAPTESEFAAFSKICTHAGCPVGLYRSSEHVLICPCHQSEFDVLNGARPINGPAVRALPRLPVRLEPDGTFTALGDFPEPVGPSFWDMHLSAKP